MMSRLREFGKNLRMKGVLTGRMGQSRRWFVQRKGELVGRGDDE